MIEPTLIRGVIFDMDGVLLESEPFLAEAAAKMFAEKGCTVAPEEFRPYFGMGEDHLLKGVADAHGFPLDPGPDKARTYAIYLEVIHDRIEALPGVRDFIASCKAHNLPIALASSADRVKVDGNLREIEIPPETFDAMVTGSDVAEKKPAPDIFLEAARRLGVDPRTCLVVEDAIVGVAAARAAGARCLAVSTNFPREKLADADWVVPDLSEAPREALEW